MQRRITEAHMIEAIATRQDDAIEESICERIGRSLVLHVDDSAIPFIANVLTPQGRLDRLLKNLLREASRSSLRWSLIAYMAKKGSRTKAYADMRAAEEEKR